MRKLLIPLLLLLTIGCKEIFTKPKLMVSTPKGWVRNDTSGSLGSSVIYITSPKSTEIAGLINAFSPDTEKFIKAFVADLKSRASVFELQGEGKTILQREAIKWLKYHIVYKRSQASVDQKFYFIKNGSYVLNASFTTLEGRMQYMQPAIDEIIQSIRFK